MRILSDPMPGYKEVVETEAPNMVGLVGLKEACLPADTVHSILITRRNL